MQRWIVGLGMSLAAYTTLDAQALVLASGETTSAPTRQVTATPAGVISVDFRNVPLLTALQTIADKSGISMVFSSEQLPKRSISYSASNVPVETALAAVLRGTNMRTVRLPGGALKLVPGSDVAQGTIVGKVINAKTKQPIAGANVSLGDDTKAVTTGADGTFRLLAAPGEHAVRVRAVGMTQQTKRISVQEGASVSVDVEMTLSASVLDEVIVTGTVVATARKEIATPITVITGEELEKRGITRIEQLFRGEIPGLIALEEGVTTYAASDPGKGVSSMIYSRGSASLDGSPNPIKTYVDGVELVDPSYLGTIDPQSIEKIEIVTGPQAATIYGSGAMGGVMQIFTKRGSAGVAHEVNLTLKYGMLQNNFSDGITPTHNDALSLRGGSSPELTYAGNLSYNYTGQWQPKLYNGRAGVSLGATHTRKRVTVSAAFSVTASRQGTYKSDYVSSFAVLRLLRSSEGVAPDWDIGAVEHSEQVSLTANQMASLNIDVRVTPTWPHHLTLGKSQNVMTMKPEAPNFGRGDWVGSDTLFLVRRASGQRFTWNYNTSHITAWSVLSSALTMGANGSMGDQINVSGAQVSKTATNIIAPNTGAALMVQVPMNDQNWGAFGSWRVGLFKQLYTTLGLRMEQNPRYGRAVKFDLTPTNGLAYTLERGAVSAKFMGSYGRATRPPKLDQRLESIAWNTAYEPGQWLGQYANPDLRPEYSRGPQGGVELYIGNRASLTVNHYQQTVTDLIQRIPVDSFEQKRVSDGLEIWRFIYQYANVAKIRQTGWEGTGALQVGVVSVKGTYSWNESKILSVNPRITGQPYAVGETFRNVPTHSGNITVGYAHGGTNLMLVTNVMGQRIDGGRPLLLNQLLYARLKMYAAKGNTRELSGVLAHPGYAVSNLNGSHRIRPNLTFTLNVVNVGNSIRSDFGDLHPTLGRQSTLGFSYRFNQR